MGYLKDHNKTAMMIQFDKRSIIVDYETHKFEKLYKSAMKTKPLFLETSYLLNLQIYIKRT